jgi:hypothetical protein
LRLLDVIVRPDRFYGLLVCAFPFANTTHSVCFYGLLVWLYGSLTGSQRRAAAVRPATGLERLVARPFNFHFYSVL